MENNIKRKRNKDEDGSNASMTSLMSNKNDEKKHLTSEEK